MKLSDNQPISGDKKAIYCQIKSPINCEIRRFQYSQKRYRLCPKY